MKWMLVVIAMTNANGAQEFRYPMDRDTCEKIIGFVCTKKEKDICVEKDKLSIDDFHNGHSDYITDGQRVIYFCAPNAEALKNAD